MNKYTFTFSLILLMTLGFLVYLASIGNVAALVTLAVLAAVSLILVGVGITLVANYIAGRREQRQFMANAKENFMIVKQTQDLINAQNSQLWQQAVHQARLPEKATDESMMVVDESLFTEFEE